jgi:hypothetical protein
MAPILDHGCIRKWIFYRLFFTVMFLTSLVMFYAGIPGFCLDMISRFDDPTAKQPPRSKGFYEFLICFGTVMFLITQGFLWATFLANPGFVQDYYRAELVGADDEAAPAGEQAESAARQYAVYTTSDYERLQAQRKREISTCEEI